MDTASPCQYGALLPSNFPHIMEQIFLLMDYESFKICFEVCKPWRELLMSDSLQRKAKHAFSAYIVVEEEKLVWAARHGKTELIKKLLSTKLLDINCSRYPAIISQLDDDYDEDDEENDDDDYRLYDRSTPLFEAVDNGHADAVGLLLDRGAKPDNPNEFGYCNYALQSAAVMGYKKISKLLIDGGANVNMENKIGNTPLHYAAAMGNQPVVQILLDRGADPNITNKNGQTPLSKALDFGYKSIEHILLEKGAMPNQRDYEQSLDYERKLLMSIRDGDVKDVKSRLLGGVNVNFDHSTPLREAIYFGHKDIVLLLLSSGANPNPNIEEWNRRPLTVALIEGKRDMAQILLDAGAEPTEEENRMINEWSTSSETSCESDSDTRSHSESDSNSPSPSEADLGRGKRQTSIKEYFVKK